MTTQAVSPLLSPTPSRSPSPTSKRTTKPTIPSPLALFNAPIASPTDMLAPTMYKRPTHSRTKSASSVQPAPFMQRSYSLPSPSRLTLRGSGPPPPSPKWNITTTPATPTYRNSIQPTFNSPTTPTFPGSKSRPTLARTATPPPPRTPPSYLTTEVFPGSTGSYTNASYPPSLTSGASTPTSSRSRSPSIYSLETIEDSPDAELEAVLEEEMEKENEVVGLGIVTAIPERVKEKRKRWSVCGAERRVDLDLDTIWED